jgi:hypothetical protein
MTIRKFFLARAIIFSFFALIGVIIFLVSIFRPLPQPTLENTIEISGVMTAVRETGDKDITIYFEDDQVGYYINRGLERDLTIEKLNMLRDSMVRLRVIENSRHIARLTNSNGDLIFNEIGH